MIGHTKNVFTFFQIKKFRELAFKILVCHS